MKYIYILSVSKSEVKRNVRIAGGEGACLPDWYCAIGRERLIGCRR
jgi:hypothetical protein